MDARPGTDTINRLIAKVNGPVLLLFDELLNLFSRHRSLGEPMHAFLHNGGVPPTGPTTTTITLSGNIPAELWNRFGTRVLPKLRTGKDLKIGIHFSVIVEAANADDLQVKLKQILTDLGLQDSVGLEQT